MESRRLSHQVTAERHPLERRAKCPPRRTGAIVPDLLVPQNEPNPDRAASRERAAACWRRSSSGCVLSAWQSRSQLNVYLLPARLRGRTQTRPDYQAGKRMNVGGEVWKWRWKAMRQDNLYKSLTPDRSNFWHISSKDSACSGVILSKVMARSGQPAGQGRSKVKKIR